MKNQLRFLINGSEVKRYHTVRTLQSETVGHHSHGVATLCMIIEPYCSVELLKAALLHDLAEYQLGDIPSPAKKKYGIGEQVNKLEADLLESVGFEVKLTDREARILKLADIFQGMIFCLREMELGNQRQAVIFDRYAMYAQDMIPVGREKELFDLIAYEMRGWK